MAGNGTLSDRLLERVALAPDASHYLLTPALIARPTTAAAVAGLMRASAETGLPLTFRSGGTSLSGQGVTDQVLVDVRRHFRGIDILSDGALVRVGAGATLRSVNSRLARYHRKLGPDPASEIACTVGGLVANNSSGMACGTEHNAYRTLASMVYILPSGTVIDSSATDADDKLRSVEPELYEGLGRLRDRVRANRASVRTITSLFSMKNTMGYSINAFVDHTLPLEILTHLVIGSEGTLAFVVEATFNTVPANSYASTGLLLFTDLSTATASLPHLIDARPAIVELLDGRSLGVAARDTSSSRNPLARMPLGPSSAALLVEYQYADSVARDADRDRAQRSLLGLHTELPPTLSSDPDARATLWKLRKGIYASIAAARPTGSSALLEDVVVPVGRLLSACNQLVALFDRHGYHDTVTFGHAKDGNLHFMLTDRFDDPTRRRTYERFTDDLVELVLGEGGSLKAEHGTGRTMAPFVRRQYGDELYEVMTQIKVLCDPNGILNPGVLITDDSKAHVRHLKTTPPSHPIIDSCVECGYCEPVCPSKDLTLTPRQRIAVHRALFDASPQDERAFNESLKDTSHELVDTCAVDGMCQTACPVGINTGNLVKDLRRQRQTPLTQAAGRAAARNWDDFTLIGAAGLRLAAAIPRVATTATRLMRRGPIARYLPQYDASLPVGGKRRAPKVGEPTATVYVPSCLGSLFGAAPGVSASFQTLAARTGVPITIPEHADGLCCGTPWSSKGLTDGYGLMASRLATSALQWQAQGATTIVTDASSCTEGLALTLSASTPGIVVVDAVDFALEHFVPRLSVQRRLGRVALHPTCSTTRAGRTGRLKELAATFAEDVAISPDWGCCGMAGDRGLLQPELTLAATFAQTGDLKGIAFDAYLSDNRACQLALTRASTHQFRHILEQLEEITRT